MQMTVSKPITNWFFECIHNTTQSPDSRAAVSNSLKQQAELVSRALRGEAARGSPGPTRLRA